MFPLRDRLAAEQPFDNGLRDRNKMRTRLRSNSEAIRLFAERGYDNTSVQDIADAAEVSLRKLFRYFCGKDEILFARDYDLSEFFDNLGHQPAAVPALHAIRVAYTQQRTLTREERDVVLQFRRAVAGNAALQGRFLELQHRFRQQLAGVLAKRGGRRKPADVDEVAAATAQTLLDLAFSRWIDRHGRGSLTQLVDAMFSTLDEVTGEATESTEIA
jgi:AcrR family transcriptional regulator